MEPKRLVICRAAGLMGWTLECQYEDGKGLLDLDVQARDLTGVTKEARKAYPDKQLYLEVDDFWLRNEVDPTTLGLIRL